MKLARVDFTGIAYLVGFAAVGFLAWQVIRNGKRLGQAVADGAAALGETAARAVDLVNPASSGNLVNRTVNQPIGIVTGGDTLGTWLASKLDPASRAAEATAAGFSKTWANAATPENIVDLDQYRRRYVPDFPISPQTMFADVN